MKLAPLLTSLALGRNVPALSGATEQGTAVLAAALDSIARDLDRVESVREIKDMTRSFAQLAGFGRWDEMASLFADDGTLQWTTNKTSSSTGRAAIGSWLRADAGKMNGLEPGSLDFLVIECPVVNLSTDGLTARGRWESFRYSGDGKGNTRLQGGVFENEYVFSGGQWRISLLGYHGLYNGPYVGGPRLVNRTVPLVPYHFSAEETRPIPKPVGEPPATSATPEELAFRIQRLNDEDEVRNLQHAYGYYVDRRMWSDVVDLFVPNSTVKVGQDTNTGASGIRKAMERTWGPEGLSQGVLNDHPIWNTLVDINADGTEATTRGLDMGMMARGIRNGSWEFNVFHNNFVKVGGLWKFRSLEITPLIVAEYTAGWGSGSLVPLPSATPPFLNVTGRRSTRFPGGKLANQTDLLDMQRRLSRSAGYDAVENLNGAYGFYADDQRCDYGTLHAPDGNKLSPFTGWYHTPARIKQSCYETYGASARSDNPSRSGITFHWRPQPVIRVSHDGRSASSRTRLYQPSCSNSSGGSFNGAIYHDQMALIPTPGATGGDATWMLWSITIDEHYFTSNGWAGGWAAVAATPPNASRARVVTDLARRYPPDVTVADVGERESTFRGGNGTYISWPDIQRMWFAYRNPVTGRTPEFYWPGCVPCKFKREWSLGAHGYQEPPTGPSADGLEIPLP